MTISPIPPDCQRFTGRNKSQIDEFPSHDIPTLFLGKFFSSAGNDALQPDQIMFDYAILSKLYLKDVGGQRLCFYLGSRVSDL